LLLFFSDNRRPRELILFAPFPSILAVGNATEIFNRGTPDYTYPRREDEKFKDDTTYQAAYKRPPINVAMTLDWHTRFATTMREGYKNSPILTASPSPEIHAA
jgi:hypothetical protein